MTEQNEQGDRVEAIPVVTGPVSPGAMRFPDPDAFVAFVQKRDELLAKVVPMAIKATKAKEWNTFGGGEDAKPRPDGGACLKMIRRTAITAKDFYFTRTPATGADQDDAGPKYLYTCYGTFELPGGLDVIQAIGTCSTRDPFFGTRTTWVGEGKDKEKIKEFKKLSEVDEDDVKKKARTNCIVNGTMEILGIKGITWPEMEAFGFDRAGSTTVSYGDKAKGTTASTQAGTGQRKGDERDDDERNRAIGNMMDALDYLVWSKAYEHTDAILSKYMRYKNSDRAATVDEIATFTGGKVRWLFAVLGQMKKDEDMARWAEWKAQAGGDDSAPENGAKKSTGEEEPPPPDDGSQA